MSTEFINAKVEHVERLISALGSSQGDFAAAIDAARWVGQSESDILFLVKRGVTYDQMVGDVATARRSLTSVLRAALVCGAGCSTDVAEKLLTHPEMDSVGVQAVIRYAAATSPESE